MPGVPVFTLGIDASLFEFIEDPKRARRFVMRILALLFFGLMYLVHRRFYKASELAGEDSPNPWRAALCVIGITVVIHILVAYSVKWAST